LTAHPWRCHHRCILFPRRRHRHEPVPHLLKRSGHHAPVGTWLMSASPLMAEAAGLAGFDWAVIDMEHAPLDMGDVVHLLQAVSATRMVPVVRVPWNDTVTIKRVLDAGATTLLVPFVQTADEAAAAVAATRYPPQGVRGMAGMSRAALYGLAPDHFKNANRAVSVIVQIESEAALGNLEAIAAWTAWMRCSSARPTCRGRWA
jgi:2-keto-3-deoxy-L-rhamnonate aldolase RhmA